MCTYTWWNNNFFLCWIFLLCGDSLSLYSFYLLKNHCEKSNYEKKFKYNFYLIHTLRQMILQSKHWLSFQIICRMVLVTHDLGVVRGHIMNLFKTIKNSQHGYCLSLPQSKMFNSLIMTLKYLKHNCKLN